MSRPTQEDVFREAMRDLAEYIVDRWSAFRDLEPSHREDEINAITLDLMSHYPHDGDGYSFARNLDFHCWAPDADLVDILGQASGIIHEHIRKATAVWVIEHTITPSHKVGDTVMYKGEEYKISKIYEEHAEYVLSSEAIGDTMTGKYPTGWVVPFETIDTEQERVDSAPLFEEE